MINANMARCVKYCFKQFVPTYLLNYSIFTSLGEKEGRNWYIAFLVGDSKAAIHIQTGW